MVGREGEGDEVTGTVAGGPTRRGTYAQFFSWSRLEVPILEKSSIGFFAVPS